MQPEENQETKEQTLYVEIDEMNYQCFISELEDNQSLQMGMLGGIIGAVIGAAAWAGITVVTGYQIGWMAVGVGFLVGYGVRIMGKGINKQFGIVGAILSLVGCLAGNLFSVCAAVSRQEDIPFLDILVRLNPEIVMDIFKTTFSLMDLLFYGIAIYEGYRFSFRQITEDELSGLAKAKT